MIGLTGLLLFLTQQTLQDDSSAEKNAVNPTVANQRLRSDSSNLDKNKEDRNSFDHRHSSDEDRRNGSSSPKHTEVDRRDDKYSAR